MNTKRLKIIFTLLLFIVLIVLALPEFSVNIQDKEYTYPSVGFSKIGIGADYGSFTKGKGIYAEEVFKGIVSFDDETTEDEKHDFLKSSIQTIQNRLNKAKITDITVEGIVTEDEYAVYVTIPDYYESRAEYARALLSKGDLQIQYLYDTSTVSFDITIENVKSVSISQNIRYTQVVENPDGGPSQSQESTISGLNLILNFDKEAQKDILRLPGFVSYFQGVINGQDHGAHLAIDGESKYDLVGDDNRYNIIRAIPNSVESATARQDIAEMVLTYFEQENPLEFGFEIDEVSSTKAPNYNPDGTTYIAISFIIGLGLLVISLIKQIGLKKALAFSEMLSFTTLLMILILKFVQTPISTGLVIGVVVLMTLYSLIILSLMEQEDKVELNKAAYASSLLGVVIMLALLGVYISDSTFGVFNQTIETVVAGVIALIISMFVNYKFIVNTFILNSFSIRNFFGIKKSYE